MSEVIWRSEEGQMLDKLKVEVMESLMPDKVGARCQICG